MKKWMLFLLVVLMLFVLTGCLPSDGTYELRPAGFFWGIWHGWMAPLSLVLGFFNHTTRIYEVNNVGWLYDLGFYAAVISGFGGFSFSRHRSSKKEK